MRLFVGWFIGWWAVCSLSAQEVTIKGQVTDSLHHGLAYTNIVINRAGDSTSPRFRITDADGRFRISLNRRHRYRLTFLYMGYKEGHLVIDSFPARPYYHIVLQPEVSTLKAVRINVSVPVQIKGDTVRYQTRRFVNGTERKLKDVLEKLPGVEIEENGQVKVMGKTVTGVYVEGKSFFGGSTRLALENIPAHVIDQIEAIKNYNAMGFMRDVEDSQQMILNIKLKKNKRRFVFGNLQGGWGPDRFYQARANLFYYSPRHRFNLLSDVNNTGRAPFSIDDFLRWENAWMDLRRMKQSLKDFQYLQNWILPEDFYRSRSQFAALQWQGDWGRKWETNTFGIGARQFYGRHSENSIRYLIPNLTNYSLLSEADMNQQMGILKTDWHYRSDKHTGWDTQLQYHMHSGLTNEREKYVFSPLSANGDVIRKTHNARNRQTVISSTWYHRYDFRHIIKGHADLSRRIYRPGLGCRCDSLVHMAYLPFAEDSLYRLQQDEKWQSWQAHLQLKYYWKLAFKHHLYFGATYDGQQHELRSEVKQIQSDNTSLDWSSYGFGLDDRLQWTRWTGVLEYKWKTGRYSYLKTSLKWQTHTLRFISLRQIKKWNRWLPEILFKYERDVASEWHIHYYREAELLAPAQYLQGKHLNGLTAVETGNPDLMDEAAHHLSLFYSRYRMSSHNQFYAQINFVYKPHPIQWQTDLSGIGRLLKPVYLHHPAWSVQGRMMFNHQFKYFFWRTTVLAQTDRARKIIEGRDNLYETHRYEWINEWGTYWKNYPSLHLRLRTQWAQTLVGDQRFWYAYLIPALSLRYHYKKQWFWQMDARWNFSRAPSSGDRSTSLFNMLGRYEPAHSPWQFGLIVQNLFNTRWNLYSSSTGILVSETTRWLMPRILLVEVSYRL